MANATSLANLKAGDMTGLDRDAKGRIETSRAEMGRTRALAILENPTYQASLLARMIAGTAGPVEVWIHRIGYGDPPRPKDDTSDDEARFDRLRAKLRAFMKENPQEARTLGNMMARQSLPPGVIDAGTEKDG